MEKLQILILITLLILTACNANLTGNVVKEDKVKIGVSIPHTSYASTFAEYVLQGLELAMERLPEEEREKIELVAEDDQCRTSVTRSIAERFVEIERITYVIGPFCAASVVSTMDYYENNEVVRMATGMGTETYSEIGNYDFILLGDVESLMRALAEKVYNDGHREVVVLYQHDDYGEENKDVFRKHFEENGGEVIFTEAFDMETFQDYRTSILKAKAAEPDAVLIAGAGRVLLNILEQAEEVGLEVPIYSIRNTEDTDILKNAGNLLEGVTFPSITVPSKTEEGQWYAERYKEKYGAPHEVVSANAYDSFMLLWDAIKECGENTTCTSQKLRGLENYSGVSGTFSVSENGLGLRNVVIKQVKNGSFEII